MSKMKQGKAAATAAVANAAATDADETKDAAADDLPPTTDAANADASATNTQHFCH